MQIQANINREKQIYADVSGYMFTKQDLIEDSQIQLDTTITGHNQKNKEEEKKKKEDKRTHRK